MLLRMEIRLTPVIELAGAEGFEPPLAVLETAGLPLNLRPYFRAASLIPVYRVTWFPGVTGASGSAGRTFSARCAQSWFSCSWFRSEERRVGKGCRSRGS